MRNVAVLALCAIAAAAAEPATAARKKPAAAPAKQTSPATAPKPADKPKEAPKKRWGKSKEEAPKPWYESIPQWAQVILAVLAAEFLYCSFIGGRSWLPKSKGCHVIITGGSEGLGKALAHKLVARGHFVSLIARTRSKLDAAVLEINEASKTKKCIGVVGDVTSSSSIESALQAAERAQKLPADAVVCNAGSAQPKLFLETEGDTFKRQMDLNYMGVVRTVRAALPGLLERDSGALVLVSSGLALTGYAGYAAYAPTKWAVRGLAEVLRSELAATRVSVHLALPPGMATPGFDKENAEKPRVTRAIEAGEPTHQPESVAAALLSSLQRGHYACACGDFGLGLLVRAGSGLAPRTTFWRDLVLLPFIAIIGAFYRRMWDFTVRRDASREDAVEKEYPVLNEALKSTEATFNDALQAADDTLKRLTSDEAPAPAPGMMERLLGKKEEPPAPGLLDSIMGEAPAPAPAPGLKERVFGAPAPAPAPGLLDSIIGDAAPAPAPAKK
ncbi:unnamed protein product [Pelagomonas calceolata]|uniref:3-dehydrosphinganine reductase n=1 Tax=Pelagomonas calceolata TaxID=35677 RepID=A0A8J2WWI1_9STRA|nr:unnamed protein product [Pelagomonas calceolata]